MRETQCRTCEHSRAIPIGSGSVLRCEDPVAKPGARLKQWELARLGGCRGYMRATGAEG